MGLKDTLSKMRRILAEYSFAQKGLHELNCPYFIAHGYNQVAKGTTLNGKGVDAVFWTNAVHGF
jgi:hypothetical protein